MSNQREMTKKEIQGALECFGVKCDTNAEICENCPYIDFCWNLEKIIKQKPKKYI